MTYQPNANDHDHRLLADSGAGFRTTFAQRISSARYVAAVSTEPVEAPPEAEPVVQLLEPLVRGGRATIRWRRSLLAASYDVATRPPRGRWRIVAARRVATSYRVRRPIGARLAVRVRARGDAGDAGAWSASQTVAFVRRNTG